MKRNLNKAFTLIELLAVIVILAIIALIATPIILGIVEDARKDSFLRSVELVVSTTDIDIANKTFEEMYTYEIVDGDISNLEIGVKNTKGMNGTITYDENGNEEYAIHNGVYCVRKTSNMENAEISDFNGECANIKYTDASCFVTTKAVVYEITDKEKCQTYFGQMNLPSEEVTSICNNEPHELFERQLLTENLSYMEVEMGVENILSLISEIGVTRIEKDDEVSITDYICEDTEIAISPKIDGLAVTSIAAAAFKEKGLTSVKLPSSVTSIGEYAFASNKLSGELDLSHLTSLTRIGNYVFQGAYDGSTNQITSLKLPSSVTSIGESAFTSNKLSGELDLSHLTNLTSIGKEAFVGFPDGSTNQISSVKLPSSVTSIGKYAFYGNKLSDELDLSHLIGLTSIEYSVFSNNQITSLTLPSSVTSIDDYAFSYNKLSGELDLSYLTNLTSIENYVFQGASDGSTNQISSVKLPSSVTGIGNSAFAHNKLSGELDLSYLTNLTFIGNSAFEGSYDGSTNQITSLKLPSGVTTILDNVFRYNALTSVTFYGRSDLTGVTTGANVWGWATGYSDANIYFINE